MPLNVILDGFHGDGGKGVLNSYLVLEDNAAANIKSKGPSAGHTTTYNGNVYKLRMVPTGFPNPDTQLLMCVGSVVDPNIVLRELDMLEPYDVKKRFFIDEDATAIRLGDIEKEAELKDRIGSVQTGYSVALGRRVTRQPAEEVLIKYVPELKQYTEGIRVDDIANDLLDDEKMVIIEGSHGMGICNFLGREYPNCNAYPNGASALLSDVGIGPKRVDDITLVLKSYVTKVGEGFLRGELSRDEVIGRGWNERATVSGRDRRAAEFDDEMAKNSARKNTATQLAITCLDKLFKETAHMRDYDSLPREAKEWLEEREDAVGVPITLIKTGPNVYDIIDVRKEKGMI
jgi:adenylosuccinate synthase